MKKYKFITIQPNNMGKSEWEYSEKLTNEWTEKGWTIEQVSPISGSDGKILLILSKTETMLLS